MTRCVMCVTTKARYDAQRECLRLVRIHIVHYYRVNKPGPENDASVILCLLLYRKLYKKLLQ